ncbi:MULTISPECIES: DoxX family membrane protein [Sphingobacterium]|uniref:DoxX family membrane protein n=1 Tax=Sphingobacterium kitahiroshimense TaxID=470446 RepID=A0ABV0BY33_9SPHI|nr:MULTISPECIES: DoxX family membrane protein [Sphingobacterium]MBB2950555.1 putative membrane protein YphA (DoxX/SURF4 family) [Sphingobacterium sp. JUb56]MCS3552818.1 putative membrane protein YphA (DoxX/SURF4 family) [Sphingobacterium sp. JUb21]MCW2259082.1 putative membrane protein YphA (DoxX/SURF4 family) [Sphingobacterium kitahiroshimense]QQD12796.1 DoxX family membrane protein [Sphingobacterium sp. UDSM-2020]TCR10426.1 DoxX-like protein [Sphingobacterium sp. JUb20]
MKNKILFVLCLLTGLMFINAGLDKFFHYMPMPKDMPEKMINAGKAFMEIGWLMPLVAFGEITGGLLLIFSTTRALGAVILTPILTGILLSNITTAPSGLPIALVLAAIVLWVIIENWHKYLPMLRK